MSCLSCPVVRPSAEVIRQGGITNCHPLTASPPFFLGTYSNTTHRLPRDHHKTSCYPAYLIQFLEYPSDSRNPTCSDTTTNQNAHHEPTPEKQSGHQRRSYRSSWRQFFDTSGSPSAKMNRGSFASMARFQTRKTFSRTSSKSASPPPVHGRTLTTTGT